jgi:very-short-patch-repair endonuclease
VPATPASIGPCRKHQNHPGTRTESGAHGRPSSLNGRSLRQRLRNPVKPAKHNFPPVDDAPVVHRAFRPSSAARILAVVWQHLAATQAGILTRGQALRCGLTRAAIHARLSTGRWQRVHYGVLATFSGKVPREARLWAAVLACGADAVLSHETAAEISGLTTERDDRIHVTVPHHRRVSAHRGIVVHRAVNVPAIRHPALVPPRTRIEHTVLDLAEASRDLESAMGWLARAVGARLTTPARIGAAVSGRKRLRRRRHLLAALEDVAAGCHSVLELHYLRRVERAHHLPVGDRQHRRGGWYDDVAYTDYGVCVELDGRAAHPADAAIRDRRRDNAAALSGARVLRYGYSDVTTRPCAVATDVSALLAQEGWPGTPARCGRDCDMGEKSL